MFCPSVRKQREPHKTKKIPIPHVLCWTMTTMTAPPDGALRRTRQLVFVTMLFVSLVVPASAFFSISSPLMPSIHQSRRSRSHLVVTAASGDDADDSEGGEDSPGSKAAAPVTTKPGVNGPVRLSGPSRIDEYKSPVNFEKGVTKGPGPLSPRWSDSGRWEKDQDRKAESGEQSAGEQQFLLKEKYGTYFRVPNPATLMTSKCARSKRSKCSRESCNPLKPNPTSHSLLYISYFVRNHMHNWSLF